MSSDDFLSQFEELLGRAGWPTALSPWDLVERWEALVADAASGYQWGLYEFDNEVRVRDLLDRVLHDPGLMAFPQLDELRRRVSAADRRMQEAAIPNVKIRDDDKPWWLRVVLAKAG